MAKRSASSSSSPERQKQLKIKDSKTKKPKARKRVSSSKPKKPPTAFFYFLEDFRKGYQEEHPDVKSMRDIGKACGEKWKTMTYEVGCKIVTQLYEVEMKPTLAYNGRELMGHIQEKVQYYDIATEKRAEFDKAMAAYVKRKERGDVSDEGSEGYD